MSEFVNARGRGKNFRRQLLATASAIALMELVAADLAKASDDDFDHPVLWIELGGQLSRLNEPSEPFTPPNMVDRPSTFLPSQKFERMPLYSIDRDGTLLFEPSGTDWVLSASVRYGRSSSNKHVHQQTHPKPLYQYKYYSSAEHKLTRIPGDARFADTIVRNQDHHFIVDFQAGKDVGLGMLGRGGSSVFNLGVRFAQFDTKSKIGLKSNPDWKITYKYAFGLKIPASVYHSHAAAITAARSFHGIGPSISWNASAPLLGNAESSELTLDWGVNAAVLFGRQHTDLHHQSTLYFHSKSAGALGNRTIVSHYSTPQTRKHAVTVPNLGGFAGASWRIQNFKVSAGYRADFFFGAMDGGIDARKNENVGFYGPFASVSVGLGG